jgi:hypothetical protein
MYMDKRIDHPVLRFVRAAGVYVLVGDPEWKIWENSKRGAEREVLSWTPYG